MTTDENRFSRKLLQTARETEFTRQENLHASGILIGGLEDLRRFETNLDKSEYAESP